MSSTPQDRNVIATSGRSTATEDEVYRVLDIKDFSTTGAPDEWEGGPIVVPETGNISILNYPIYENLLQLTSGTMAPFNPWSIMNGVPFGWYERTVLVWKVSFSSTDTKLFAINLDNTSEIQTVVDGIVTRPADELLIRNGEIYSGFKKLNTTLGTFEDAGTFTAVLPNGQLGTTSLSTLFSSTSAWAASFNTEEYSYFASTFSYSGGSDTYLSRVRRTGNFNLEVICSLDPLDSPLNPTVFAVYDTHVWWGRRESGTFRVKKWEASSGTSTNVDVYADAPADVIFDDARSADAWPQPDGSLTLINQVSFTPVDMLNKGLMFTNVTTSAVLTVKTFNLSPFVDDYGSVFKRLTNEYFFILGDTSDPFRTKPTLFLRFYVDNLLGVLFAQEVLPSRYSYGLKWSESEYGEKIRWTGYDYTGAPFALYESVF
jgi:hypothetical protein